MKKIFTLIYMLTAFVVAATAQKTVEWDTAPNFKPNDNASVYYVGITTPGTTDATYTMTAFSFYETTGYGAEQSVYALISSVAPTAENGWKVPQENVLGISNENTMPTAEGFVDYTIAGEGCELQGGTTYYMVFVKSNETNDGFYEVGTARVRLQNQSSYPATVCMGNGQVRNDLTPRFKATLTTFDAFDVTYKAFSTVDNQEFASGTVEGIVGQMAIPVFENYQFSHATLPDGTEFDATQEITQNMELYFYYNPMYDIDYVIQNAKGEDLISKTILEVYGSTITKLPEELDQSLFYDYSEINFVVDNYKTIYVTATMKKNPLVAFNEDESGDMVYNHLKLKGNNYLYFASEDYPNVGLATECPDDQTSEWAFVGNPYQGFSIKNRAANSAFVLGSGDPNQDGRTGADTYVTLDEAGIQAFENWIPRPSSYATNGFYLFNDNGYALNLRDGKVAYWTTGHDSGSTFVAEKILTPEEVLENARQLLDELRAGASEVQIGYPTADALAAFEKAINDAAEALNNGGDGKVIAADLEAATTEVKSPANTNYTPRTDVYYTITNERGSMVYDPAHAEDMDADGNEFLWYSNNLNKENANHQWGFTEVGGMYYMYNVGKRQFAGVTTANPQVEGKNFYANGTWMFSNAPSSVKLDAGIEDWVPTPAVRVLATSAVTGQTYAMSISTSYTGPVITYDGKNDGGIPMTFAIATTTQDSEVTAAIETLLDDPTPFREGLQTAITQGNEFLNKLNDYPVGEDLNQYTMSGSPDDLTAAISAAETVLAKDDATKEELTAAITAISEAKDAITLSLNMPKAGMWLRFTAVAHGTMLSAKPVESPANRMAFTDEADGSTVFYFDGEKLTSLDRGLAVTGRDAGKAGVEGVKYWFEESTLTPGKYNIRFNPDGGTNRFLYAWDSSKAYADQYGVDHENCVFTIENMKVLPLTMTEYDGNYFAAISLPTSIASVNAARVQNVFMSEDGTKVAHEPSSSTGIPANTGVLLMGVHPVATLVVGDYDTAPDNNVLLPLVQSSADFTEGLVLGAPEGTVGFWEPEIVTIKGDEEQGTEDRDTKPVRGFTAYLSLETAGTNGIELAIGDSGDGIELLDAEVSTQNGAIYNLQGQRVNKAQRGVFIQNGKKIVIR